MYFIYFIYTKKDFSYYNKCWCKFIPSFIFAVHPVKYIAFPKPEILENVPVSHGCPFGSYGPTGEVSLLYQVYFARYGPKPRN